MVSKKSAEIINKLNIPMLIYEYRQDLSCISAYISPVLSHGDNWKIRFSIPYQDPLSGYILKNVCIEREVNPIVDELIIENKIRGWIEELLDYVRKLENGVEQMDDLDMEVVLFKGGKNNE